MPEIKRSLDAGAPNATLKVFISYSRADMAFADELVDGLDLTGFETTIDRHSIIEGEDWKARIGGLISSADTIVFILSPDSVQSAICSWEVEEAQSRSKRILPVLCRPVGALSVPPRLAALNYVRFDDGRSFVSSLRSLVRALLTDVDWLREHTRLLSRAIEWEVAGRQANRMLVGADIADAKAWAANRPKDAPEPTDLHLEFIKASEQAEADRTNAERLRLDEMKAAQAARAEALVDRETAVQNLSRRTTIGLISSGTLTAAAAGLAYWGVDAEQRFRTERERVTEAEKRSLAAAIQREASRTDIVGQFVAYAASPGQYGAEGPAGGNSPYTSELLTRLSNSSASLYEACFRAHRNVQRSSITRQRPFLSTDMNGDIYLMQQPDNRTRKAVIVSVDRLQKKGDLYNVRNDIEAWEAFLKEKCHFEVLKLHNPDSTAFLAAFEAKSLVPTRKQGLVGGALLHKVGLTIIPEDNTLLMFVFAGFGAYKSGANYLMTDDSDVGRIELLPTTMIPLIKIQDAMRQAAAASIVILDSNFPDLDAMQKTAR